MLEKIVGNEGPKAALSAALSEGRLTHSVLLVGEEGCGAGFAARCLVADRLYPGGGPVAEAVVQGLVSEAVTEKDGDGSIVTGQVREVIALRGDGAAGSLRVGAVRALRAEMFNTALTGEGRAAILYGVQNLTQGGANALLKILEEPPAGVLFVLTASNAAAVLPTIRSRCAQYTLGPVSERDCESFLRRAYPGGKNHALLSVAFGGRIGRAEKILKDPREAALFEEALQLLKATAQRREYDALVLLARHEKDRGEILELLDTFASLCEAALTHGGLEGLTPRAASRAIPVAGEAQKALSGYVNTKLVLTNLGIRLAACAG